VRPWQLVRSDRRTVSVSIDENLNVIVRAPRRMPRAQIEAFVQAHEGWIEEHLSLQAQRNASVETITVTAAEEQTLRRRLREELTAQLPLYAARMGVRYTRLTITGAQTRWGSCSGKNALSFSWRMMQLEPACREYVMVHELAHILHHDHSPAFYREIARILPDYRARETAIRTFSRTHRIAADEKA